jgi:hypothetical protein
MRHNRCLVSVLEKVLDKAGEMGAHVTIIDARAKAFGSAWWSINTTHRNCDQCSQPANLRIGYSAMASYGLGEIFAAYDADVVSPGNAVHAKAGFAGTQQKMSRAELLDRSRKRNYQDGAGVWVAVSGIG